MNTPIKQANVHNILNENNIYLNKIHHKHLKKRSIFPEKFSESIKNNFQDDENFSEIYNIQDQKIFDKNLQTNKNSLESLTNNFLNMILVQIKNQDPTHPIDNNHLTSQMTQMHTALGIERLSKIMQEIKNTNSNSQAINLSNWIGRTVMIAGNPVISLEGKKNYGFKLSTTADRVMLTLTDLSGNAYIENYYNLKPGIYKLNINNVKTTPEIYPSNNSKDNIFKVNFEAFNNNGDRPEIHALKSEKINNIIFKNSQAKLALEKGNLIDVQDVISIE